jgi:DNA ligase (NAD+)
MADLFESARIDELAALIKKYQDSYYNGEAEIEDAEFDKLWDELKALDPNHPILKKVGADSGNFEKASHVMPMGSQEKAADPEQFLAWAAKHVYPEYLVEYKLDGASLELQYQKGRLVRAVTRGDGSVGDDITANAKKMKGVLSLLEKSPNFTGGVRGEVIMTHSVHKKYFSDKANCRNAANGLMKRKDGEKSEYLCLITYDALSTDGPNPFKDEEEKIAWLVKNGFESVPLKICKSPQEVIDYRAAVMETRPSLEYDIDGLVVKEREINLDDASRARPDRQIAFKFSLEEAVSVVREVEWSENGATYTPVAIFDAVQLAGTTVQRASLANPDTLRKLGVQIGSHVVVVKRGEIIPKIVGLVPHADDAKNCKPIEFPQKCSVCGSALLDTPSRLYCPNKACPKRVLHQIFKWIECSDIRDLGDALVNALFSDKKLRSISDIYSLDEATLTPYFLNEESIQKEKDSLGAKNVVASIKAHSSLSLAQFVAGFDIEGIGEQMVEKVIEGGFDSLEKLLSASAEDFEKVYGFAQITAAAFAQGLAENADEMRSLAKSGAITIKERKSGALAGKSFCFTGELKTMKRADAEALVKEKGGSAKSSVTKDLTYLVTNDKNSGSGKNAKAAKFGIAIINEEEFLALVK